MAYWANSATETINKGVNKKLIAFTILSEGVVLWTHCALTKPSDRFLQKRKAMANNGGLKE